MSDDFIDFTPETGFVMEHLAPAIVRMMRDLDLGARLHLPDGTAIEIEQGCTAKEIIAGYNDYLAGRRKASNKNDK